MSGRIGMIGMGLRLQAGMEKFASRHPRLGNKTMGAEPFLRRTLGRVPFIGPLFYFQAGGKGKGYAGLGVQEMSASIMDYHWEILAPLAKHLALLVDREKVIKRVPLTPEETEDITVAVNKAVYIDPYHGFLAITTYLLYKIAEVNINIPKKMNPISALIDRCWFIFKPQSRQETLVALVTSKHRLPEPGLYPLITIMSRLIREGATEKIKLAASRAMDKLLQEPEAERLGYY